MPRLFILGDPEHWHSRQLVQAASRLRIPVNVQPFESLKAVIKKNRIEVSLEQSRLLPDDTILVRQMPKGSLQQIIFRMNVLHAATRLGIRIQNPVSTLEIAIDKFHLFSHLSDNGIPLVQTQVSQTMKQAIEDFKELGCRSVVKPLFGGRGKGIEKLESLSQAESYFERILNEEGVVYQQPFIKHPGWDLRILVTGKRMFAVKRKNSADWRTNLSLGGTAEPHQLNQIELELCEKIKQKIKGQFFAIDLIYNQCGNPFLLEVNGVPGWKGLQDCLQVDIAQKAIETIFALSH